MSITNKLNQIKNAIYGKEVRGAIHDAIKQVYDDASVNHDNANMEVKLARGTHDTLNDRLVKSEQKLDETNIQLSKSATKEEVDVERRRIDTFVTLQQGSTTGDAELIDGRIGCDGFTYNNIGDAIRNQIKARKDDLSNLNPYVNLKYNTSYQIGGLVSGKPDNSSQSRIVSSSPLYAVVDTLVGLKDYETYRYTIHYVDGSGNFLKDLSWQTKDLVIPRGTHYMICLARVGSGIDITDNIENNAMFKSLIITNKYTLDTYEKMVDEHEKAKTDLERTMINQSKVDKLMDKKHSVDFALGQLTSGKPEYTTTSRIVSKVPLYADSDTLIHLDDYTTFRFALHYVTSDSTLIKDLGWQTSDARVPKGTYFMVCVARVGTGIPITVDVKDSELFKTLNITDNYTLDKFKEVVDNLNNLDSSKIPDYYQSHIEEKIDVIREKLSTNTMDKIAFIHISDQHYPANKGHSPALIKKIIDECKVKYIVNTGDFIQEQIGNKNLALDYMLKANNDLIKLPSVYLPTVGNHDDNLNYSHTDSNRHLTDGIFNDEYVHYLYHQLYLDNPAIVWGESGKYYYFDDPIKKVRFVCIDVFDGENYESISGDLVKAKKYEVTQKQIKWLINEAFNINDSEYSCIVFSHTPLTTNNYSQDNILNWDLLRTVLKGFKNKTSGGWESGGVDCRFNFTSNQTNFVACFSGHIHIDQIVVDDGGLTHCTTNNDSFQVGKDAPDRTEGTITEQSFDVVIVDKSNSLVNIIKIGAGDNRSFNY